MHGEEILAYLEAQKDFLKRYADQLGLRNNDRVVVPLAERQLLEARDQKRQLEARLSQLLQHGETNDLTNARMHQLALAMVQAESLDALVAALTACFANEFGLDRVALKLWHPKAEKHGNLYNGRNDIALLARNLTAPYCGPYVNDEVLSWFPTKPVLQSFAQVALKPAGREPFGLLVLAFDDPERFTLHMHTEYLARIGELISTGLVRVLGH
jgi:uncharacterized protein YigA (DUF484 family)